jgi:hypothetical protein
LGNQVLGACPQTPRVRFAEALGQFYVSYYRRSGSKKSAKDNDTPPDPRVLFAEVLDGNINKLTPRRANVFGSFFKKNRIWKVRRQQIREVDKDSPPESALPRFWSVYINELKPGRANVFGSFFEKNIT